jgi:hypothetical protein
MTVSITDSALHAPIPRDECVAVGDGFTRLSLGPVSRGIDDDAPTSRKSSIFLRRIVSSMFMRVNATCAHQVRPPLGYAMTVDVLISARWLTLFTAANGGQFGVTSGSRRGTSALARWRARGFKSGARNRQYRLASTWWPHERQRPSPVPTYAPLSILDSHLGLASSGTSIRRQTATRTNVASTRETARTKGLSNVARSPRRRSSGELNRATAST